MKHIITLASFVLLAWIGCKKSDDIPTPDTPLRIGLSALHGSGLMA